MKQNMSFFAKLIGKNAVEPEPGDIFYFNKQKCYWIYTGPGETIDGVIDKNWDQMDISSDGKIHIYSGLDAIEYIKKLAYDSKSMYKVNDDIIFHYKFKHDRSVRKFNFDIESGEAKYIMTLKGSDFDLMQAAYIMYEIGHHNK